MIYSCIFIINSTDIDYILAFTWSMKAIEPLLYLFVLRNTKYKAISNSFKLIINWEILCNMLNIETITLKNTVMLLMLSFLFILLIKKSAASAEKSRSFVLKCCIINPTASYSYFNLCILLKKEGWVRIWASNVVTSWWDLCKGFYPFRFVFISRR